MKARACTAAKLGARKPGGTVAEEAPNRGLHIDYGRVVYERVDVRVVWKLLALAQQIRQSP